MKICEVESCVNRTRDRVVAPNTTFYAFPKDPQRFKEWEQACGRKVLLKTPHICSRHFTPQAIILKDRLLPNLTHKPRLTTDAVPTVDLPNALKHLSNRTNRIMEKQRKEITSELLLQHSIQREKERIAKYKETHNHIAVQTGKEELDPYFEAIDRLKRTEAELARAKRSIGTLQAEKQELENELKKYKKLFSPCQQRVIKTEGKMKVIWKWSYEDITTAATFYAAGSKAYALLKSRGFPLPTVRTLMRFAAQKRQQAESKTPEIPLPNQADPLVIADEPPEVKVEP